MSKKYSNYLKKTIISMITFFFCSPFPPDPSYFYLFLIDSEELKQNENIV